MILFTSPGAGALAVVWTIGIFAIALGVLELILALRFRGHHQRKVATA